MTKVSSGVSPYIPQFLITVQAKSSVPEGNTNNYNNKIMAP